MRFIGCRRAFIAVCICFAAICAPVASAQAPRTSVYAGYESLIGEWEVTPAAGGAPVAIERFSWGPGNSYIWFAVSVAAGRGMEPHFEGMLVWNGVNRNLDMLLVLDLAGGRVQESGTFSITQEGFLRDIMATYSEGTRPTATSAPAGPEGLRVAFRQTFERLGPDRMRTRLQRREGGTWVPTFPGSDNLIMTRRRSDAAS